MAIGSFPIGAAPPGAVLRRRGAVVLVARVLNSLGRLVTDPGVARAVVMPGPRRTIIDVGPERVVSTPRVKRSLIDTGPRRMLEE